MATFFIIPNRKAWIDPNKKNTNQGRLMAGLALGVAGVNMGTRFMATQECPIHPNIKQKMIEMQETETVLTMKSLNNPIRVFRTSGSEKILALEAKGRSDDTSSSRLG